jgi:hypothetical protein
MHTIQVSRGSLHYRLGVKKMRDGEMFLEDLDNHSRIRVWACLEDGQDPIDITAELNQALTDHTFVVNTEASDDNSAVPHGASEVPTAHRLAAYDGSGRLKTAAPEADADAVRFTDLNTLSTSMNLSFAAVNDNLTQIKLDHTALDKEVRDLEQKVDVTIENLVEYENNTTTLIQELDEKIEVRVASLVDSAPDALNTLNELANALGRNANFATTVMTAIGKKADQSEVTAVNSTVQTLNLRFKDYTEKTDEEIAKTKTLLQEEVNDRFGGDVYLQTQINSETTARASADEGLLANLNAETTARIAADDLLQSNLNAETTARIAADEGLLANLHDETTARIAADEGLLANLNAETTARASADEGLLANLHDETTERIAADEAIDADIGFLKDEDARLEGLLETHTHDDQYYTESEVDVALGGKSDIDHTHDDQYYTESEVDTKLGGKSDIDHTHDDQYYTESEVNTALGGKSDIDHTHDDQYYTESEVDTKLGGKSDTGHTHDDQYYTESEVNTALGGKSDIDHTHSAYMPYTGGTFSGAVNMGSYTLTVPTPTLPS